MRCFREYVFVLTMDDVNQMRVVKKRGLNTSKQSRIQTSTSATVDNNNGG